MFLYKKNTLYVVIILFIFSCESINTSQFGDVICLDPSEECSTHYSLAYNHPIYNPQANTCNVVHTSRIKSQMCRDWGHVYFDNTHVSLTPALYLVEQIYPEIIIAWAKYIRNDPNTEYNETFTPQKLDNTIQKLLKYYQKILPKRDKTKGSKCFEKDKEKVYEFTYTIMTEKDETKNKKAKSDLSHTISLLLNCVRKAKEKSDLSDMLF